MQISILLILPVFMAFLAGLAMFSHARRNTLRGSLITLAVAILGLPFGIFLVVILAGVMMGRTLYLSADNLILFFTGSGPVILLWFGPPMVLGVALGQWVAHRSRKKAAAP